MEADPESKTTPIESDHNKESINKKEEIEPKLKYTRITNDLLNIIYKDAASCGAVHPKFICIGTHFGWIYMLDHLGNHVKFNDNMLSGINAHSVAVNMISVDINGNFIASCSDDGKVLVYGFYTSEYNQSVALGRLVKCVAIDPHYSKASSGRRFVTGDERLVLHERTFLSRTRSTVLSEVSKEGGVQNVKWSTGGQHLAWATGFGVRVYDLNQRCSLGLIKWSKSSNMSPAEKGRCNLCWRDRETLLVAWQDCVRVLTVHRVGPPDNTHWRLEEVLFCHTDCVPCGIGPLGDGVVLLSYWQDNDDRSQRPQVQVLELHPQECLCTDNLSLRGYQNYNASDYSLECLVEENCYLVISPKDLVIAVPYDADDRIDWLIDHFKFEDAMNAVTEGLQHHSQLSVGKRYLDYLMLQECYEQAASLCQQIFGDNKRLWEDEVFRFARVHQLRTVSPYLPKGDQRLDPHIYEMVLYEFLKMDPQGFLEKVKEWHPSLYNVPAVVNATLEHLLVISQANYKNVLLEALALLYSSEKKYDRALQMYLKLKHQGVFELITKHKLYSAIHNSLEELMQLNTEQTLALLLWSGGGGVSVAPDIVVSRLSHNRFLLYQYLDALDQRKELKYVCQKYHGILVRLYADFAKEKLLCLLRRSNHYPIQEALIICQDRCFYPEMVYILGRIGNTREALQLITQQIGDIEQAINFCKEHDDPELWQDLIDCSLNRPDFITFLLQKIGTYIDPHLLVQRIDNGLTIPGLKNSLVKLMQDYNLQVSVQEGCKKILVSDYFNLHQRLVCSQKRGVLVDDENFCGACHRKIIVKDVHLAGNIVIFYCHHMFHEECLPTLQVDMSCVICNTQKSDQLSISNSAIM